MKRRAEIIENELGLNKTVSTNRHVLIDLQ